MEDKGSMSTKGRRARVESFLFHLLPMGMSNHFTSLNFSVLIYKMGMIIMSFFRELLEGKITDLVC